MTSELEKIQQDIRDFIARIQSWNYDDLSDDELEDVHELIDDLLAELAGETEDEFEAEDS
ncbi:MAG: hypothetical protein AABX12_05160 [Nanoarchaeota archaeon]